MSSSQFDQDPRFGDLIANTAKALIIGLDRDGKVVFFNRTAEEVTGWARADALGRDWFSTFLPERYRPDVGTVFHRIVDGDDESAYDNPVLTKRGGERWVSWRNAVLRDARGRLELVVGTGIDVTERRAAEQALQKSEAELRAFADAMPNMAFIADARGNILYYNERHYAYFGVSRGETEAWQWVERRIHHPDDLDRTLAAWSAALRTGEPYEVEYRLRRHDGAYRWHLGRAAPARDEAGAITRWFGTNTDIHEQKESAARLEQALRAREEFISIASHELRTPLTSMRMQLQLFERRLTKEGPQSIDESHVRRLIDVTAAQLDRLTRLVNDMLDVSRIATGKLSYEYADTDLSRAAQDVVDAFAFRAAASGAAAISAQIEPHVHAEADAFRIEQVFSNLVSNAVRYGEGKPIEVALRAGDGKAFFSVRDHGAGIPAEAQRRIFNRFERGAGSRAAGGLGLGLFIADTIVRGHGGRIDVESEPGRGAVFTVELPLHGEGR